MMYLLQIIAGSPEKFTFKDLIVVGNNIIGLVTAFAVGTAVIAILWGAYLLMSSFGSEERAKQGKNVIYWSLIGVAVIMLARVIIATGLRVIEPKRGTEFEAQLEQTLRGTVPEQPTQPPTQR